MEESVTGGVKVTGKRSPRWAFMNKMVIPSTRNAGETYLTRLRIIQTPWFGVYVHDINEPDYDFHPHDHPWSFISVILRGGYTERVWPFPSSYALDMRDKSYLRRWRRWSWHSMDREKAHKIEQIEDKTLSLIFVGKRVGTWGFYTEDGWLEWSDYKAVMG
jgi:hypothetical protein